MATRSPSAQFSCHVESFRRQDIPGTLRGKVSTAYISAHELVKKLDFDEWMEVNPRVPKRTRKGVLSGHVISGIWRTLDGNPSDFALKNLGLYILADAVDHDRGSEVLSFRLSNKQCHGLCNGGHTYAALRAYIERPESEADLSRETNLSEAFVRLQIFEGIDSSKVVEIAEGLNRSRQVDDASLDDLGKKFEIIRRAMDGQPGELEIGYHMGDVNTETKEPCAYYITEIVRYLMFFNCGRYDGTRHPYDLYRHQKRTMDLFREDVENEKGFMRLACNNTPKILRLWHQVCQALPDAESDGRRYRRMEVKPRGKDGKANTAGSYMTKLHFIDSEVDCAIFNGWVMPMVAAFRADVAWDVDSMTFDWKIDPNAIIPNVIGDFYRICAEAHDNGRKPDEVGRDGSIYSQMYDKVDQYLMRRELDLAREELRKLQETGKAG
ncbi:MAG: AIPR family protein [Planctomycetes bacterium]|nr:AIPR family protein [Planctomycetota bacterium]